MYKKLIRPVVTYGDENHWIDMKQNSLDGLYALHVKMKCDDREKHSCITYFIKIKRLKWQSLVLN